MWKHLAFYFLKSGIPWVDIMICDDHLNLTWILDYTKLIRYEVKSDQNIFNLEML